MYNPDTELLFPIRVISTLGVLRGEAWQALVSSVSSADANKEDQQAFVLMMVRLGGCITCSSDSFRAMRGCTQCAWLTVRRFRGTDQALLELYSQARGEIMENLTKKG